MRRTLALLKPTLLVAFAAGCTGSVAGTPEGGAGGQSGNPSSGGGSSSGNPSVTGGTSGKAAGGSNGLAGAATSSGGSSSIGTGGAAGTMTPPSTAACPTVQVARTPLRRLTRFEYANTVRDLLNVDPSAANELPVDEVTDGFNNNAGVLTVSALHAEKYVLVSEALAKAAVKAVTTLTGCDAAAKGEDVCAAEFARNFGRRAFRRPTTAADEQLLMAAYSAGKTGGTYAEGIEVMIRAALQSTHFLYRLETTTPTSASAKLVPLSQFELGTRLSYLIWGSGPDDALLDAASRGELGSREQVAAKARAMLQNAKARPAISDFYNQWMGTSRLDVTSKSSALFPAYSPAVRDAMAQELPAFVQYLLWTGDHKFTTLLTAPIAFVNNALAPIYGTTATGTAPQMVMLPASQNRAGILTQAGFLSVQAHPDQTSPVLRGKFIRTKLLCQPPPPPPVDADITPPDVSEGGTARERFSLHLTAAGSCTGCHQLMDPIGFAFENFDALGQYRTMEAGQVIDASGEVLGASDPALRGAFNGVRELATKLANSDQVRDCVATQWFRFAAGRGEESADSCSLGTLQEAFAASGGDLVELVVAMTQTDAFWYRSPLTP
jgi:hypothetical protein